MITNKTHAKMFKGGKNEIFFSKSTCQLQTCVEKKTMKTALSHIKYVKLFMNNTVTVLLILSILQSQFVI